MQCNIDAKGKRFRLISGLVTLLIAIVLGILAFAGVLPPWTLWLALATAAGGAFQVYEARKGWCALRAMGLKTPV